jgi:tetratricopeptide (TPR) repeat protein
MFENEDDDAYSGELNSDVSRFEEMFNTQSYAYFDADRIEAVIDHLLVSSQYKKAKWAAENAFLHFPYNNLFLLRKAQAMSLSGELKEALSILLKLDKIEKDNTDLLLTIANCFSQLKDTDSSIRYFKKAIHVADQYEKGDIAIDLAMEYENANNYNAAIEVLSKAMKEDPENESIVYELAYCYDQVGKYELSIECFLKYIDENPYSYTAWYNLANAYGRVKNYEKAIWAYDYCIVVNEDFSPAYYNLGNTYVNIDEQEKAIVCFEKCLELDGEDAMVFCSLGECYEDLARYEEAYDCYVKSSDLLPQLADAWLGRGIVNTLRGDLVKAVSEFIVAIDLEPDNAAFYHAMGNALEDYGDIEQAVGMYRKGLQLDTVHDDLIIDYLKCLMDFDLLEMIKETMEDVYNLYRFNSTRMCFIAALWQNNRRTDALLILDELKQNDPSLAKSLFLHFPSLKGSRELLDRIDDIE